MSHVPLTEHEIQLRGEGREVQLVSLRTVHLLTLDIEGAGVQLLHRDVVAEDVRQSPPPDHFFQSRRQASAGSVLTVGEEEPVSVSDILELFADDAGECWSHNSSRNWILRHSSCERIDFLHVPVDGPDLVPGLLVDVRGPVVQAAGDGEATELPEDAPLHFLFILAHI